MALHYARLAEAPGTEPREPLPAPSLRTERPAVEATRRKFGIAGRYAVFCPGAEYGPAKRWPYFAQLAARVPLPVLLLGSANDREACAAVPGRNLAGETTLDEAIELIADAAFVVTNDSGLMHVAAAVGTPQVALFGSSSPKHTPPRAANARTVWLGLDCSPCFARECPLGHFRCMREMSVERVLGEIAQTGADPSFDGKMGTKRVFGPK
jgi:heptosyltransferase-2